MEKKMRCVFEVFDRVAGTPHVGVRSVVVFGNDGEDHIAFGM